MDSNQFVREVVSRIKAGFGGIAVKTVEGFDLVELLALHQVEHSYVLITIGPNDRARVHSGTPEMLQEITAIKRLVDTQDAWAQGIIDSLCAIGGENAKDLQKISPATLALASAIADTPQDRVRFIVFVHNSISDELRKNPMFIHMMQQASYRGRAVNITYMLHTDSGDIGPALSPYYPLLTFPTPDLPEIVDIIEPILTQRDDSIASDTLTEIADACRGLTRREVEDIAAVLSTGPYYTDPVAYKESKIVKAEQDGLFRVINPQENAQQLFGLDGLYAFAEPLMRHASSLLRPKGLLFVGPPGSGKSAAVAQLALQSQRTLCQVDFGSLRNKWVGETEARFDRMFKLVESLSPSILAIDELEKSMDGAESSGASDGGVGSRVLAKFLSWAQDHEEDVMLIATANDVQKILLTYPEMLRAERFDATFMFDLPNLDSRQAMWKYYLRLYGLGSDSGSCRELGAASVDWTGAEIKACCRLAAMRQVDVKEQMPLIPKVATMAKDVLSAAREYAIDKFVDASTGRLYKGPVMSDTAPVSKRKRKIDPSSN